MVDYLAHFESTLAALKDEHRYRVFADLERQAGIAAITARHT
jgi:5-aminolevulinate synthase